MCVCICWYKYTIINKNARCLHKNKIKKFALENKLGIATAKARFKNKEKPLCSADRNYI
jgi:hypothetical protein